MGSKPVVTRLQATLRERQQQNTTRTIQIKAKVKWRLIPVPTIDICVKDEFEDLRVIEFTIKSDE